MNDLIKSAGERIKYNVDLMVKAAQRGDPLEAQRFQRNIVMMMQDVDEAVKFGNSDILETYKGW